MFDKQYRFKGQHAVRVDKLTAVFDPSTKSKLFSRNVDVYTNAPIIGYLYNRRADLDNEKNPETGQVYNQNVMGDMVIATQPELIFNFRLIILLDKDYEPDVKKRIDKAFRYMGKDPNDEELFNSYVRGGVDVLYEKLIMNSNEPYDYISHLLEFIGDFNEKFNKDIANSKVLSLLQIKG